MTRLIAVYTFNQNRHFFFFGGGGGVGSGRGVGSGYGYSKAINQQSSTAFQVPLEIVVVEHL